MKVEIVSPTRSDIDYVAKHMKDADVAEVYAATGYTAVDALDESIGFSQESWAVRIDGEPCAIFGIASDGMTGLPWLLTTEKTTVVKLVTCRESLRFVYSEWLTRFPLLRVATDARHHAAHRLLNWLGFKCTGVLKNFGHLGLTFYRYELCATQ